MNLSSGGGLVRRFQLTDAVLGVLDGCDNTDDFL